MWWQDHNNLAEFVEWYEAGAAFSDEYGFDRWVVDFLAKPWKWTAEYEQMRRAA